MAKPIALAADHGGFELKEAVKAHLDELGLEYIEFGTHSTASVDYPYMALPVTLWSAASATKPCCSAAPVSASAWPPTRSRASAPAAAPTASAASTPVHNDANALCMGGRVVGPGLACQLVDLFLNTPFEGGRHEKGIAKLMAIETR